MRPVFFAQLSGYFQTDGPTCVQKPCILVGLTFWQPVDMKAWTVSARYWAMSSPPEIQCRVPKDSLSVLLAVSGGPDHGDCYQGSRGPHGEPPTQLGGGAPTQREGHLPQAHHHRTGYERLLLRESLEQHE